MAEPYDYTLHVDSPFKAALQGYQAGAVIRDDQSNQALLQQQQQQALIQRQQQQQVLNNLLANPNAGAKDYANATLLIPALKDQFKQSWEMKNEDQKQAQLQQTGQVYAALINGKPQIAAQQLKDRAAAMESSGGSPEEVAALRAQAQVVEEHPEHARMQTGMMLAALPGGDKIISAAQAPADLAIKNAEAGIKSTEAAAAPAKAQADLANTQSQIEDRKAGQRIAELNTQIGQANSETQRGQLILQRDELQLKRDDAQAKRDITKGETGTATQDALDSANALKEQIKGVANHPGLEAGTGTLSGIRSYFNSTDANDFRKAVEGLKSPVFLNELGKLKAAGITLGQVTEAEGKKLEQRISNLDPDQSTPSFKNQVGILMKDTEKFINKIVAGGKLPTTGGAFIRKIPGIGEVRESDINKLLMAHPGSTREQAIQYLDSLSGTPQQRSGATGAY